MGGEKYGEVALESIRVCRGPFTRGVLVLAGHTGMLCPSSSGNLAQALGPGGLRFVPKPAAEDWLLPEALCQGSGAWP